MEEKLKEIISVYINVPADKIGPATVIDRSAVNNSIMLHRMYARLAEAGIRVNDYWSINNFGGLIKRINGEMQADHIPVDIPDQLVSSNGSEDYGNIGIDIEDIAAMPETNDFRENEFYKMNFSPAEIAYCILQPRPYSSFAGLFAAKEAIVKANNAYKNYPFNSINIEHTPEGKPYHPAFRLSIAHTGSLAIAVAVKPDVSVVNPQAVPSAIPEKKSGHSVYGFIALVSFILALIALFIALKH